MEAKPADEPKGSLWKIAVAAWMKQTTEPSHGWLAERLHLGSATRACQVVGTVARQPDSAAAKFLRGMSEGLATRFLRSADRPHRFAQRLSRQTWVSLSTHIGFRLSRRSLGE